MKITIIVPAYNEEQTVKEVILDFHRQLPNADIYVIDNNSSDNTDSLAQETLIDINNKGKVIFEEKIGKANAIRSAFTTISSEIYVMVDADSTYSAVDIHQLAKPIIHCKADMVVGDRISKGKYLSENKRLFHSFGNNLIRRTINTIFGSDLNDITSGYRVFSQRFVKNYPILVEGFELESDMTLHALDKKFTIVEIPIDYKDRPKGTTSKLNTIRDGFKIMKTIFRIFKDYRPLLFFGVWAILFLLSGIAAGLPVIIEFIMNKYILHIPLAILSTGLIIVSLISLAIGLILDTVSRNQRFNYEHSLINFKNES